MKHNITYFIIGLSLLICFDIMAQKPISLDEAIRKALDNNAQLRTESKKIDYQLSMINTSKIIEPTQFSAEIGQFNSAYFDTGLSISQSFQLPTVYKKRKEYNLQKVRTAEAYFKMSEIEIKQQLDELFTEYYYLHAKYNILLVQDSLFTIFQQKATLRYQNGETDILEKITADQQKVNIAQQVAQVDKMKLCVLQSIEWIINDGSTYVPEDVDYTTLGYNILIDTTQMVNHPVLRAAYQEYLESLANTSNERATLLPQFNVAYRNVGIQGTGADNVVYGINDRFSSVQIGVGIPLFRKGFKSSIASAQAIEAIKLSEYDAKNQEIGVRIRQNYGLYNETIRQINRIEQQSLPNAKIIQSTANKKFTNGEINYLEYILLIQQSLQIESDYIELIRSANSYIINLYYLTNNY